MAFITITTSGMKATFNFIEKTRQQINQATLRLGKLVMEKFHNEIKSRTKRIGSTGKLISSIRTEVRRGQDFLVVGIGNTDTMFKEAPYWYVVNYGVKLSGARFIPGGGKMRPVVFSDGNADPSKRGKGTGRAGIFAKIGRGKLPSQIRPMHYIERTNSWLINFSKEFFSRAIQ